MMNKVFFLPVNTGYGLDGNPDDRLINFYKERSGKGIYCSIVGNVVIPNGYGSNNYCVKISNDPMWYKLAHEIKINGSIPGIQLSSTWGGYKGIYSFTAKKNSDFSEYKNLVLNISENDIDYIFMDFKNGVDLAYISGFEHIQIHAAHGYLMSLLIDDLFCINSVYSLKKLNELLLYINSKKMESSVRFSLKSGFLEFDKQRDNTIKSILSLNLDYFDISFGFYNINKNMIYPTTNSMLKSRVKSSLDLVYKNFDKKFIISGKSLKETIIPYNASLGICRDIIANPNYLIEKENYCEDNKQCHYHSRGEASLTCKKWLK